MASLSINVELTSAAQLEVITDALEIMIDSLADQRKSTKGLAPEWTKVEQRRLEAAREVFASLTGITR